MPSILDISVQTAKTPTKLYMGIDLTTTSYDVKTKLQMLKNLKARMFIDRISKVKQTTRKWMKRILNELSNLNNK